MSIMTDVGKLLAHMTLNERLHLMAVEMDNLQELTVAEPWMRSILEDIEEREYKRALQKTTGNWEPSDPPGFEGGFADNH